MLSSELIKETEIILQYLKYIKPLKALLEDSNGFTFLDSLKSDAKSFAGNANIKKIDSFVKLFYKLFLYSLIGIFAKIISKILRL